MILLLVLPLALCGVATSAQGICLEGDFDSQVQWFIDNVMFSSEDEAEIKQVLDDLKDTMQRRWPGTEVYPHGSSATGVGIKSSDADCYVKIPNFNTSADLYVLGEASRLLQQQPHMYTDLRYELVPTTGVSALLTFRHARTGRSCDVTFTNNSIYQSSAANAYYFNLNDNYKPLVAIIKDWFQVHHLDEKTNLISFNLYLLVIFYLQQLDMVPPAFALQRNHTNVEGIWDLSFDEIPYNSTNTASLYQLLGGFFTYYSDFNFKEFIVSPYAGRPIRKSDFLETDSLPDIFYLYKRNMRETELKPIDTDKAMIMQSMFEHHLNVAETVTQDQVDSFTSQVQIAAKLYKDLPRDEFLKALLSNSQDEDHMATNNCNNTSIQPI
ncbi:unnamed protein product [Chrysodeixis includens]|uniref:PAP-associated domain-containing protein n=1 Tax=Chrysodeixis includens TaxID=689277 RepID=A0A9N8L0T5_CHRIL|nr:unnamed protein product [Chrysodeixis includens]